MEFLIYLFIHLFVQCILHWYGLADGLERLLHYEISFQDRNIVHQYHSDFGLLPSSVRLYPLPPRVLALPTTSYFPSHRESLPLPFPVSAPHNSGFLQIITSGC